MIEKSNYKKNKSIDLGDILLNGQGVGKLATCRYGLFPIQRFQEVYSLCRSDGS